MLKALSDQLAARPGVKQILKFLAVGGTATVFQYTVLAILVEVVHAHELGSTIFAYLCGSVTTYVLNRRFTFAVKPPLLKSFATFAVFNLIGLGFNTAIVAALLHAGWYVILAQAVATGIVTIYNFFVARFIVFRS